MEIYIIGTGNISPQNTTEESYFVQDIKENDGEYMVCTEADYRIYIDAMQRRRMSKIIRRGIAAAKICLEDAETEVPDAIITGTGWGSIEDTENFLMSILQNGEKMLNPTSFIQSTYNSISTQIAIALDCHDYNCTYVHRAFSFESALLDAILLLKEKQATHVLVGGADEITPTHFNITKRTGVWKKSYLKNTQLLKVETPGTICGEGATFFMLNSTKQHPDTYAKLQGVCTFYRPQDQNETIRRIEDFLKKHQLLPEDIDILLCGINGDVNFDKVYYGIYNHFFHQSDLTWYKHLCGEYFTSTAFALWLASLILKKQKIPSNILLGKPDKPKKTSHILIWNHYKNVEHSLILVSKE
jgi:3-oxoacyl-[acyl-carrier-protein] synthase II